MAFESVCTIDSSIELYRSRSMFKWGTFSCDTHFCTNASICHCCLAGDAITMGFHCRSHSSSSRSSLVYTIDVMAILSLRCFSSSRGFEIVFLMTSLTLSLYVALLYCSAPNCKLLHVRNKLIDARDTPYIHTTYTLHIRPPTNRAQTHWREQRISTENDDDNNRRYHAWNYTRILQISLKTIAYMTNISYCLRADVIQQTDFRHLRLPHNQPANGVCNVRSRHRTRVAKLIYTWFV